MNSIETKASSDDVKEIFDPLIDDIKRLVDQQVNLVQKKRISESHSKADEIKVSLEEQPTYQCISHHVGNFSSWGFWIKRVPQTST